jgi:hypothetical protein
MVRGGHGTRYLPRALIACFSEHTSDSRCLSCASPCTEIQEPFVRVPGVTQVIEGTLLVHHPECLPAFVIRA